MSDDPSKTKVLPDGPAGELPPGAELNSGMYRVTRKLAEGGFGITYEARDNLERKVAIKECFPAGLALRAGDFTVSAASASTAEPFETARNLFLREARTLANLRHPNVVHVQTLFEENGTAYMAMDYVEGRDLLEVINSNPDLLTPAYVMELTRTLLGAMDYLHRDAPEVGKEPLLHRDIKPANIRIDPLNAPVIIDFGAAKQETKNRSRAAGTFRVVSDGYSPSEFYVSTGNQGPASDLYSLAATLYHCITGTAPTPADERALDMQNGKDDPYEPLEGRFPGHDPRLLGLIDRALSLPFKDRPENAAAWFAAIPDAATRIVDPDDAAVVAAGAVAAAASAGAANADTAPEGGSGGFWKGAAVGGVALALLSGGGVAVGLNAFGGDTLAGSGDHAEARAQLEQEVTTLTATLATVQEEADEAISARDLAQARVGELSDTIRDLRNQLREATAGEAPDTVELRNQLNQALVEQELASSEQRTLEARIAELEGELATALEAAEPDAEVAILISSREEAVARAEAAEAEITELEERLETLREASANPGATGGEGPTNTELLAVQLELEAALAARDAAITARDDARRDVERAQSDLERMAASLQEAEAEANRLNMELRDALAEIERVRAGDVTPNPGPNLPAGSVTAACPSWDVPGPQISYIGNDIYTPQTHTTTAGGPQLLGTCSDLPFNATGFAASVPNFTFLLSEMERFQRLQFEVAADCDATLLVNTQDTVWHFDDDSNGGTLPLLNLTGQAAIEGRIDVWVGTADGSSCDAALEIETWLN